MLLALRYWTRFGQVRAWRRWSATSAARARAQLILLDVVHRLAHASSYRALRAWKAFARTRARVVFLLRRTVGYLSNRAIALGFASWQEALRAFEARAEASAVAMGTIYSWRYRRLKSGWCRWHEGFREQGGAAPSSVPRWSSGWRQNGRSER